MEKLLSFLLCLPVACSLLVAQSPLPRTVQAVGNATIMVNPDQVQLDVGVITSATTAQEAAQQNSTQSTAVQNAIKQVLGSSGSFQTASYSVYPRYSNPPAGQTGTIIGYTASNTIRVTTTNLSIIGRLIDTANQAGANSIGALNFSLQDPDPSTQKALGQAAKMALANANAIAAGLGARTGAVVSAQQGSSYIPIAVSSAGAGTTATTTPVQTGTINVYATVTLIMALIQ